MVEPRVFKLGVALLLFGLCRMGMAQVAGDCGSLQNAYGPYDYTNPTHRRENLSIVEAYHFDSGVEQLSGLLGQSYSEGMVGGDLDYTLRAFPNHHRALYSMIRYHIEKVPNGSGRMPYTAECYLDRAKRFAGNDSTVIMLEGIYYHKKGRPLDAKRSYERALQMAPDSAEVNYNAGLMFIELEEYDKAMEHAARAYELGHPLQGLRNKLVRLGMWREPDGSID